MHQKGVWAKAHSKTAMLCGNPGERIKNEAETTGYTSAAALRRDRKRIVLRLADSTMFSKASAGKKARVMLRSRFDLSASFEAILSSSSVAPKQKDKMFRRA